MANDTSRIALPSSVVTEVRLITSQIDTAPKHDDAYVEQQARLITSQIDTAPKQASRCLLHEKRLITSQIDTAPKHAGVSGRGREV